ncbi:MAG: transporter substrate-binding domain-containing protein [Pseudomonadota bacterium]
MTEFALGLPCTRADCASRRWERRLRVKWAVWVWLGAMLTLMSGAGRAEGETPSRPVFTVLVLQNSPYMSYHNEDGVLVGFNVEVGRLLCRKLKVHCEIRQTLLADIVDKVASGEADIGIASLTVTPERAKRVLFTVPYMRGNTFWVGRSAPAASTGPIRVAAVNGSTQHDWVLQQSVQHGWTVTPVKLNAELADALVDKRVDAVVAPIASAMNIMKRTELSQAGFALHPLEAEVLRGPLSIALNPAHRALLEPVNRIIQDIQQDGQLDRINSRYFPFRVF